jgi:hypothetical protein
VLAGRGSPLAGVGALWVLLLGLTESPARAAPLSAVLDYVVVPDCPDAEQFRGIVSGRLGYDPFSEGATQRVLIRITPRAGALEGRIEWREPSGKWAGDQTFSAVTASCRRLVRAMAFALAVQIQLLTTAQATPDVGDDAAPPSAPVELPPPAPRPPTEIPPPSPPAAPIVTTPAATPRPRPGFLVGVGPVVGFGFSADPVLLGRVFGTMAWQRLSVEIAGEVSLPATTRRQDGAGVSQQQLVLTAAGCAAFGRWSTCVLAKAGEVRLAGEDIDRPTSGRVALVAAGGRLGFTQRLGRRAFVAGHADGLGILTRWTARLDGLPVWTAPRFAATVGIDAGVRFR